MKKKTPKPQVDIELLCDKLVLQQELKKLQLHLHVLQEVLKGKH